MAFNRKAMREAAERQRQKNREGGSGEQPAPQPPQTDQLHNTLAPDLAQDAVTDSQPIGDQIECPACAELVKARAKVCKHCGNDLTKPYKGPAKPRKSGKGGKARRTMVVHSTKSGGTAAVLSALVPGLGHLYAGHIAFGLMILIGYPLFSLFVYLVALAAGQASAGVALLVCAIWLLAWAGLGRPDLHGVLRC